MKIQLPQISLSRINWSFFKQGLFGLFNSRRGCLVIAGVGLLTILLSISLTKPDIGIHKTIATLLIVASLLLVYGISWLLFNHWYAKRELEFPLVAINEAILASVIVVGLLLMQGIRILTWWNALLVGLLVVILEIYWRGKVNG